MLEIILIKTNTYKININKICKMERNTYENKKRRKAKK